MCLRNVFCQSLKPQTSRLRLTKFDLISIPTHRMGCPRIVHAPQSPERMGVAVVTALLFDPDARARKNEITGSRWKSKEAA